MRPANTRPIPTAAPPKAIVESPAPMSLAAINIMRVKEERANKWD
jgi:hypothetical protein